MHDVIKRPIPQFAEYLSGGKVDYWPQETEADWTKGCQIGRSRAGDLVSFMIKHENPLILGIVAEAIAKQGGPDSVIVGFWQQLAEELMTGKN